MVNIQETLIKVTSFVRCYYWEAAMAAGVQKREFKGWAEAMARMGVAIAWKQHSEFDETKGSLANYAIYRTKDVVRAFFRQEHRPWML